MKKGFYILLLTLLAFAVMVVFPAQTFAQKDQIKIPVLVYHYFAKDLKEAQEVKNTNSKEDKTNLIAKKRLKSLFFYLPNFKYISVAATATAALMSLFRRKSETWAGANVATNAS